MRLVGEEQLRLLVQLYMYCFSLTFLAPSTSVPWMGVVCAFMMMLRYGCSESVCFSCGYWCPGYE